MDSPIRPEFFDIFINKPLLKVTAGSFFPLFKMVKKVFFIGTINRATKTATIINPIFRCIKAFPTNKTVSIDNFLHIILSKLGLLKTAIHHNEVVGLESQEYNGKVYNFGTEYAMSYFAEKTLVANCRCVALIKFDQAFRFKKNNDSLGSYSLIPIADLPPQDQKRIA